MIYRIYDKFSLLIGNYGGVGSCFTFSFLKGYVNMCDVNITIIKEKSKILKSINMNQC